MNVMTTYKHRKQDYKKGFDDGVKEGVRCSIQDILFAVIQYLGDKRGWKRERIMEAIKWLNKHAAMLIEDYLTFPDVVEQVRDEYGILYKDGAFYMLSDKEWHNG